MDIIEHCLTEHIPIGDDFYYCFLRNKQCKDAIIRISLLKLWLQLATKSNESQVVTAQFQWWYQQSAQWSQESAQHPLLKALPDSQYNQEWLAQAERWLTSQISSSHAQSTSHSIRQEFEAMTGQLIAQALAPGTFQAETDRWEKLGQYWLLRSALFIMPGSILSPLKQTMASTDLSRFDADYRTWYKNQTLARSEPLAQYLKQIKLWLACNQKNTQWQTEMYEPSPIRKLVHCYLPW